MERTEHFKNFKKKFQKLSRAEQEKIIDYLLEIIVEKLEENEKEDKNKKMFS